MSCFLIVGVVLLLLYLNRFLKNQLSFHTLDLQSCLTSYLLENSSAPIPPSCLVQQTHSGQPSRSRALKSFLLTWSRSSAALHVFPLGFSNSRLAFLPPHSTLAKWHTGDLMLLSDTLVSDAARQTYSILPDRLPSVWPTTDLVSLASSNTWTFFPLRPNTDWICGKDQEKHVKKLKMLVCWNLQ